MTEVTKEDLREFTEDMKRYMNERFIAHEKQESLMFKPIVEKINHQHKVLHGEDGRGGIIRDTNFFKWLAVGAGGTSIFAALEAFFIGSGTG